MKSAGFGAIFCNVGDYALGEWEPVRARAVSAGLACGPWLRTADANNAFDPERLGFLLDVADHWQAPLIVNSESELKGSGDEITSFIAEEVANRDAAISVECWPFANVHWYPLAAYPFLPQIFPAEAPAAEDPEACRAQWFAYGVKCVVDTYGAYGGQTPGLYPRLTPYGVYAADDTADNYQAWAPLGERNPYAPSNGGDEVEKIGAQHGISAMADIFRKQWPDKTGKPDPNDHETWKAIDKWERSQLMLVADHDEAAE
jgi:hypothetical protein